MYGRWIFVGRLFPIYSYLACCKVQCFLVRFFFQLRWKTCVITVCLVYFVGWSALDDLHHRNFCSTPLWSWRENALFSPVCIWRFLLVLFGNNIWVEHNWRANFLFDFIPGSQLFWRLVKSNISLWDIFFCFDGRLVSLPPVLCKLSVALHSIIHNIVKHVPLLFGVDVEMTCSLLSLHLTFYACDVWGKHMGQIYLKGEFLLAHWSRLTVVLACLRPMLPCEIFFSASIEDLCHCRKSCVNCRLLCTRLFTPS